MTLRQNHGGVAHLGERLHGMQEVRGSIPLISTKGSEFAFCANSGFFFYTKTGKADGVLHRPSAFCMYLNYSASSQKALKVRYAM